MAEREREGGISKESARDRKEGRVVEREIGRGVGKIGLRETELYWDLDRKEYGIGRQRDGSRENRQET